MIWGVIGFITGFALGGLGVFAWVSECLSDDFPDKKSRRRG